jgi:hypothetical protein
VRGLISPSEEPYLPVVCVCVCDRETGTGRRPLLEFRSCAGEREEITARGFLMCVSNKPLSLLLIDKQLVAHMTTSFAPFVKLCCSLAVS